MPHLLSLNNYHYRRGGSDAVYLDHAALFAEHGWETSFFSMHHPRNLPCDDSDYFAQLVDGEYADGALDKLRLATRTIYNAQAKGQLQRLLADRRFDIAHAHGIYHHLTPAILPVLKQAGVPVVLTAHDLKIACPAYTMRNGAGNVCEACKGGDFFNATKYRCIKGSRQASAVVTAEAYLHAKLGSYRENVAMVVTPSRFYRDKLAEWGFPKERLAYIPNFTDTIEPQFERGYSGNVLYFGRLSDEKGVATLIHAAHRANVPVDIVGSGPSETGLRRLADELGAPVTFLGRLEGAALWQCVGNARAIVLPSEWYENAPLSVLEAFQLGKPCIGSDIGGIPELVHPPGHAKCGWLFAPGDIEELAARLQHVATAAESELAELGNAGRELALGRFSKKRYYAAFTELYGSLGVSKAIPA